MSDIYRMCEIVRADQVRRGDRIIISDGGPVHEVVEVSGDTKDGTEQLCISLYGPHRVSYIFRDPFDYVIVVGRPWPERKSEAEMLRPILERLGIQGPWEMPERCRYQMLDGQRGDPAFLHEWLHELAGLIREYELGRVSHEADRQFLETSSRYVPFDSTKLSGDDE